MEWLSRLLLALGVLTGASQALYLDGALTAFPVPKGRITLDTLIEPAWKEIAGRSGGFTTLRFDDYGKIVLLDAALRNDDPREHYTAPGSGSVTLLAAYDEDNLYFLFLVKEVDRFDPTVLCAGADLWRAHAAELFLDTTTWSESLHPFLFSTDAAGSNHGTSRSTLELAKPAFPREIRKYYRDRVQGNRFEFRNPSTSLLDAKAFSRAGLAPGDSLTLAVEMRIPYNRSVNPRGKSLFISWGYNRYPAGDRGSCKRNPIAYRWAKHARTYGPDEEKPDGWAEADTVHYDPTHSSDGWGRLALGRDEVSGTGAACDSRMDMTSWDPELWARECSGGAVHTIKSRSARRGILLPPAEALVPGAMPRDIRGRFAPGDAYRMRVVPPKAAGI